MFNCANNLKLHVVSHVDVEKHAHWPNVRVSMQLRFHLADKGAQLIYNCQWEDCIRRFKEPQALSQHLQNHVMRMLFCILRGLSSFHSEQIM